MSFWPSLTENILAGSTGSHRNQSQLSQQELLFQKVLLGAYNGLPELTMSVVLTHQLLGSLQVQEQQVQLLQRFAQRS